MAWYYGTMLHSGTVCAPVINRSSELCSTADRNSPQWMVGTLGGNAALPSVNAGHQGSITRNCRWAAGGRSVPSVGKANRVSRSISGKGAARVLCLYG